MSNTVIAVSKIEDQFNTLSAKLMLKTIELDIALDHCVMSIQRNNKLTAQLMESQRKYWASAGFPVVRLNQC